MIGTNMLQTTFHPTAAPSPRCRTRAGSSAALCVAGVCAAVLPALAPCVTAAQGAPATSPPPPPTGSPAATSAPPASPSQLPGATQGTGDLGKKLFPNAQSAPLSGVGAAPAPPPRAAPPQPAAPAPAPAEGGTETRGLDQEIQGLKKDVVDLNKDLFILEEELLFPANTQMAVFLSVDVGDFFALDAVQLKIDQKEVINYLYTPRERDALLKGGVQRLYLGNLKVGPHELVAFFSGSGPNARAYKRGASLRFEKGVGAKYLELKINDRQRKLEPEFEIKDWE
jgi:hypothetical protein